MSLTYEHKHEQRGEPAVLPSQRERLTLGEGTTENVAIIRSGNSSLIFETKSVPIPEPVPPPSECCWELVSVRRVKDSKNGGSTCRQLESLQAIGTLRLFSHNVQDRVYEFSSLGVVTFPSKLAT